MLTMIGLGLWHEKDISLRGIEICKNANKVYCELYTAAWGGSIKELGKLIGKDIIVVERKGVEDESAKLIEEAKEKNVVLFIPGDPLVATTHIHLMEEAKENGVEVKIVHASSIYTAIAKTGLQIYKFGRTGTVITPQKGYESEGFYDVVKDNLNMDMHTLLLLDVDMNTKKALDLLKEIDNKRGENIIWHAVMCSKLGSDNEKIEYGKIKDLLKKDFPCPAVIIIPGKLHFMEREFLDSL